MSSPANLKRRLEALEESLALTDKAMNELIQSAVRNISPDDLEALIDAAIAHLCGRELTEREVAAKKTYAAALALECRWRGLTVRRLPDVAWLVGQATIHRLSEQELLRGLRGLRAQELALTQGYEPTAEESAALQAYMSDLEAQFQRAGFSSQAEFHEWYNGPDAAFRRGQPW
jgi:hypothetical protein